MVCAKYNVFLCSVLLVAKIMTQLKFKTHLEKKKVHFLIQPMSFNNCILAYGSS